MKGGVQAKTSDPEDGRSTRKVKLCMKEKRRKVLRARHLANMEHNATTSKLESASTTTNSPTFLTRGSVQQNPAEMANGAAGDQIVPLCMKKVTPH